MAQTKVVELFALTQRLAASSPFSSGNLSTVISTKPVTGTSDALPGSAIMSVSVSNSTSGTLDLALSGSFDGTNFFTLTPASAWSSITTAVADSRVYNGPLPPFLKSTATVAGTISFSSNIQLSDIL